MTKKTEQQLNALIESLQQQLEAAESRANEADEKADRLKAFADDGRNTWAQPRPWEENGLPLPRLELHWSYDSDDREFDKRCLYVLVYRHFLASCSGGGSHIVANPMGLTRVGGASGFVRSGGMIDTPFREGAHAKSDAEHLKLPLFVTTEDGDVDEIICRGPETERLVVRRSK